MHDRQEWNRDIALLLDADNYFTNGTAYILADFSFLKDIGENLKARMQSANCQAAVKWQIEIEDIDWKDNIKTERRMRQYDCVI